MKLTKEEAIKRHREIWGWLAENPMKEERDWPGWERYDAALNDCFLCEYALKSKKNDSNRLNICDYCPVEFKETNDYPKGTMGYCLGGLFIRWVRAIEPKERSRIASLIRDLPEKPENKTLQDDPRLQRVLQQIAEEVERATSKFAPFNSSHEGFAVLMEEVDELWDEVKSNCDPAKMRTEAIQVGAMAVRFLLDVCKEG